MFRTLVQAALLSLTLLGASPVRAAAPDAGGVLITWYRLVLELVRHTPTYSPPVASRAFAYLGVTAWEVSASAAPDSRTSLAGQLTDLPPLPARAAGAYDEAVVMQAALTDSVVHFFGNTGPTGQRAMAAMATKLDASLTAEVTPEIVARSSAHGKAIAAHVIAWAASDGGAVIDNMGFPMTFTPQPGPSHWVPTSKIVQQQAPLLPDWGNNRTFAMPSGSACPLPPPPDYSEAPGSAFFAEGKEVYEVSQTLTDEQKLIARFWSDDPMLSPTPPGHWISIALDLAQRENLSPERSADLLARLGITMADSFIGCWDSKFDHDLLRPVTYIRRVIAPKWEPLLITPPFPEYPSGHSTQSGAAAAVMTAIFGAEFAFDDATHEADGLPVRHFSSFAAAAEEAALSRLYGGIHFRAAIERGLDQGACIGAHATALRTLK